MAYFRSERYDPVLYHAELGFPRGTRAALARLHSVLPEAIKGIPHYQERCVEKGLPFGVPREWVIRATLVEIQVVDSVIRRVLLRGAWRNGIDLSIVIDCSRGRIITGWLNESTDIHRLTSARSARYTPVTGGE